MASDQNSVLWAVGVAFALLVAGSIVLAYRRRIVPAKTKGQQHYD
jgi:hypothetical protein